MRFRLGIMLFGCLVFSSTAQQDEGRTYFSLTSDRPVLPGEKALIRVQVQGLRKLDFRLYRVNDAVQFFHQLDDPNRFSAAARPEPKARTPIEKFAAWKRLWHSRARDLFRFQFSGSNRRLIYEAMNPQKARPDPAKKGTGYAGVPILNPQQLVRSWTQPIQTPNRWEAATVPVAVDKGLYVLEATDGKRQAYTIISATELALVAKTRPGTLLVRAVDRRSGAPVAGLALTVYDYVARRDLVEQKTNADGIVQAKIDAVSEEGVVVLARRGADFAAASIGGYTLGADRQASLTGYIYTDRPVYRPGHTVHFRAVLRSAVEAEYRIPDQRSVLINIEDNNGKSLLKKSFSLSKFGTAAGDLTLPDDAGLGYYGIHVNLSEDAESAGAFGGFQVEEYRKPDYEVKVTAEARRILQGGRARINVEARYYYGEPVAGAEVSWAAHRFRYFPPWYEVDEESGDEGEGYGGEEALQGKGRLDADGRLQIDVPAPAAEFDSSYRIEARVTDSSNRETSGTGWFTATRGPYFISVQPQRYVYGPGDAARALVETRDYDGNPVAGVDFSFEIAPHIAKLPRQPAILTRQSRTGSDGRATVDFPAPSGGSYELRVNAAAVKDTAWLWISGTWAGGEQAEERIQIVPDKTSYKTGETAKVLIATGTAECDVWLSLEGKTLYWSKFVHVKGGATTVEVPIEAQHQPNVFVEALFLRNNTLYRGSKSLKVPPLERQIQVALKAGRKEYKPGEPAVFDIEAKDHTGKPLSAEFSLGVVDEAIYAVRKEPTPDILGTFYGRVWNRVSTDTSLQYYFYGEAGRRRMQLAQVRDSRLRAQLKPDRPQELKIRKLFPDTAYWHAAIETDSNGRAQARFEFPDSLTTWRATARGISVDARVGSAVERTVVRKNLLVSIAAPRFFTEGDELTLPVLVRNYTASEQKVDVKFQASGLQIVSGADAGISVPAKGEGKLEYRVKVQAAEKAVLTAKALAGAESDGLELTLPIEPYGLRASQTARLHLHDKSARVQDHFEFPAGASPNWRSLTVHLTPSAAGAVFGALEYLVSYPYGCTEQTMSSFLPNVVVTRALDELKLDSGIDRKALNKKVQAGLDRLNSFQHEDGGWGWWRDDASDPFMTAYVVAGLKLAGDAGYPVDPYRVQRGAEALQAQFDKLPRTPADTRAYQIYAMTLADHGFKPRLNELWEQREKLSSFGWAVLGLTLREAKDGRAAEVADVLTARAQRDSAGVHWDSNRDPMLDFESDNSLEATAFAVKFLDLQQPASPLIPAAAEWLVDHRDQGYYWSSTKRTAFVVLGLTGVLKRSGELKPDYKVTVEVDGKELLSRRIDASDALNPKPIKLVVPLAPGSARPEVTIEKNGEGRLYASARWDYRTAAPIGTGTLKINRNYYRLTPVSEGGHITYAMEPLSGEARLGDLIAVRLSVFGQPEDRYLLVEDPLPSGAEVIPRDDLYQLRGKPSWWTSWYERRELHDSHVTYFPWLVPRNGLEYVYLLRFTNAGSYHMAPARVEQMYKPGSFSISESRTLEVKP